MEDKEYIIRSNKDMVVAFNCISDLPEDGTWSVNITKIVKGRTGQQNNAIHKYYRLMASALEESGHTSRTFFSRLKEGFEVSITHDNISDVAERVSQDMFSKRVRQLSTVEIQNLYETINNAFGQTYGISLPFPSDTPPPY